MYGRSFFLLKTEANKISKWEQWVTTDLEEICDLGTISTQDKFFKT